MLNVDFDKCSACGACVNVCAKDCISLKEDDYGFLYPVIDTDKCINCSLCDKVCPIDKEKTKHSEQTAYAAINNDTDMLKKETSGGVFGAVAEHVLGVGGVIYGCAFDDLKAQHQRVDNKDDLYKLFGSKYVQSNTLDTFKCAKADLDDGKLVLYSATPCQIAGLKGYLGKDYDNLVTVDIICHGVPSQAYFDKFIETYKGFDIDSLAFRSKENKKWSAQGAYLGTVSGIDEKMGKVREKDFAYYDNYYYMQFLSSDIYRNSCYSCEYANLHRPGDLTLGDLWGAEGLELGFGCDMGCSLVIANNQKAKDILDKCNLTKKEIPLEYAVKYNKQLKEPAKKSVLRETLLEEYRQLGADEIKARFKRRYKKRILVAKAKYAIPKPIKKVLSKIRYKVK